MITDFEQFRRTLLLLKSTYQAENYLSDVTRVEKGVSEDLSAYESTQRGWGLQFSSRTPGADDLVKRVLDDPLWNIAWQAAEGLTLVTQPRQMNLYLLMKDFLPALALGDVIEFGAYRGGNTIFMAIVAEVLGCASTIYACDTFSGMPTSEPALDMHQAGDFSDANVMFLRAYISNLGLTNLVLVHGLFEEVVEQQIDANVRFSLVHIDADIASSCAFAYDYASEHMVKGGYIVFDDATTSTCLGATRVVEDLVIRRDGRNSEQIWPHYVFRVFDPS
ncbi:8-demethyl-8-(2,3-dimethoxy-alpha-L-rhamnosyl)-tetracenomycin-C 4'-O-methyltransferase [BD1-7 clade bacterium]|uniref:8-demethyl-8-(2,3-dimethoxy-alpha-L-rhamnosyl)-tetracenomycin-C 4'-O-methyltransferase n=1 Tax=BD1-7 clade bacterium TaxID=2029982 RepID=A0A5S9QGR2_9GAMM|nr:8-demethyl-8-(2,3-dimethoxy-alpha-L-rhamnosyl)-tetracenomycin-C 4'-O-methyltransferase [BD1-7 clade bacterium]CAA0117209.1 8-demethyl-8-(2,3-dimethoxy-alpha-L-rhamnosyl)-tetracenomycin-C 4'-O-methyltransferase [BD1-7 clade bacterium]